MEDLQVTGRIFDIQRYSIHDGYGIRTIVFLKGCVLHCAWCCNPESQQYSVQVMKVMGSDKVIGRDVTVGEVMEIVKRDRIYYRRSNGGLTLSGGESLCQPEFARALLKSAKKIGISTALESTACVPVQSVEMVLPYLDQYLLDIKHMDPVKHKMFTGKDNRIILENARKIAEFTTCELSIRIPVIPTFNDTKEEIIEIARFASSLKTVKRVHLLPYHRLGQDKYEGLNRTYQMADILPPSMEHMEHLKEVVIKTTGLSCQIGG